MCNYSTIYKVNAQGGFTQNKKSVTKLIATSFVGIILFNFLGLEIILSLWVYDILILNFRDENLTVRTIINEKYIYF